MRKSLVNLYIIKYFSIFTLEILYSISKKLLFKILIIFKGYVRNS
jgi:hypothetical protein